MNSRICRMVGVVAASAALALLGACSGGDPASPGDSTTNGAGGGTTPAATAASPDTTATAAKNACELVTGAEAATALGLATALKAKTDTIDACEYEGPNAVDTVSIDVETQEYAKGTEDLVVDMLGKDKAKKVAGLGDAAFSFDIDFQVQYHVWAKGKYLLIVVSKINSTDGKMDAPARVLADKAVSRL